MTQQDKEDELKHLKIIEINKRQRDTQCSLIIYDLLEKLDKEIKNGIKDYLSDTWKDCPPDKGIRSTIVNNTCDNIEYIFSEIAWMIELFESQGYKVSSKDHCIQYAASYKLDWKNLFRGKNKHWDWDGMKYWTEEEIKNHEESMNDMMSKILEEIKQEESTENEQK